MKRGICWFFGHKPKDRVMEVTIEVDDETEKTVYITFCKNCGHRIGFSPTIDAWVRC